MTDERKTKTEKDPMNLDLEEVSQLAGRVEHWSKLELDNGDRYDGEIAGVQIKISYKSLNYRLNVFSGRFSLIDSYRIGDLETIKRMYDRAKAYWKQYEEDTIRCAVTEARKLLGRK